jgi:protein-S-isoprenylcysteine O-methyltransferase Ste14
MAMNLKPFFGGLLSFIVPGLGQICARKSERGALILIAVIIVGNLNALWLSAYEISKAGSLNFIGHILPRILHDVFAFYGIIFWIWQAIDAYHQTARSITAPE